jgi:hypothetical protein
MRRRLTVRSDTCMSFMWWLKWHGCVSNVLMVSQVLRIANDGGAEFRELSLFCC